MRIILLSIMLLGWLVAAQAAPIHPVTTQINLLSIQVVSSSESRGDEIYFNLTEFHHDRTVTHFAFPEPPSVWKSKDLAQVKPTLLWKQTIEQGQPLELMITLVEHDNPPWDVEDVLGTIKIHLRNNDGKLINNWVVEKTADIKTLETPQGNIKRVKFSGNHGDYIVDFQMTTS